MSTIGEKVSPNGRQKENHYKKKEISFSTKDAIMAHRAHAKHSLITKFSNFVLNNAFN
jgi:hypothetical protein